MAVPRGYHDVPAFVGRRFDMVAFQCQVAVGSPDL